MRKYNERYAALFEVIATCAAVVSAITGLMQLAITVKDRKQKSNRRSPKV